MNLGQVIDPANGHARADAPAVPIIIPIAPTSTFTFIPHDLRKNKSLGDMSLLVLAFVRKRKTGATLGTMRIACGISMNAAAYVLKRLLDRGKLVRFGEPKHYLYKVVK